MKNSVIIFCALADCVFFGCPFDASSTYRMGARFGPAAVRRASQMTSFNYAPWIERDFSGMKIFDAGIGFLKSTPSTRYFISRRCCCNSVRHPYGNEPSLHLCKEALELIKKSHWDRRRSRIDLVSTASCQGLYW